MAQGPTVTARGKKIAWGTIAAIASVAGVLATWGYSVAEAKFSTHDYTEKAVSEKTKPIWEAIRARPTRDEIKPQLDAIQNSQNQAAQDVRQIRDWLKPAAR